MTSAEIERTTMGGLRPRTFFLVWTYSLAALTFVGVLAASHSWAAASIAAVGAHLCGAAGHGAGIWAEKGGHDG